MKRAESLAASITEASRSHSLALYEAMARIRAFEEAAERAFLAGEMPGFIHVSIGQEAVAAGVCSVLEPTDYLTTTHRGHGHTLAKGAPVKGMMAELYGKDAGICRGRGGSMHIADFGVGMLGANAIVAGGIGIAVGAALSARMAGSPNIAVTFFGDGATARGPFEEAMNIAQLWSLPVLFVCENNGWASTTRNTEALAQPVVARRAEALGMKTLTVDGNDVFAVNDAALEAVAWTRDGNGPVLLEAHTYRRRGHYVGDPTNYRSREELTEWERKDPLRRAYSEILEAHPNAAPELVAILSRADAEIAEALEFARASSYPAAESVGDFLFSEDVATSAMAEVH